jgi:hypothetical protein
VSQSTARHGPHGTSEDQDAADLTVRRPERKQRPEHKQEEEPRRPVGQRAGDGGLSPDDPDEPDGGELELTGGDDLSAIDLGPAAPNFRDPDASSGRIRK